MPFDPNNLSQDRITDIGPPKYDRFFPAGCQRELREVEYHEILPAGRAGARVGDRG